MLASILIVAAGTLALEILDDLNRPFAQRLAVARILLVLALPSAAALLLKGIGSRVGRVKTASRHVLKKCGLTLLRTIPYDGPDVIENSEHGEVEYALTKPEWEARTPSA